MGRKAVGNNWDVGLYRPSEIINVYCICPKGGLTERKRDAVC